MDRLPQFRVGTAYLICGYLGAGKTTFAKKLAAEVGAIRFTADEWYMRLYTTTGTTPHLDQAKWDRMMSLLTEIWVAFLSRGMDVVLDFGFWSRASRDEARRLTEAARGGQLTLYEVRCRDQVARDRCIARNADPTGHFQIDLAAFEALKSRFEPPGPDEKAEVVDGEHGFRRTSRAESKD